MLSTIAGDCTPTTCPVANGWLLVPPSLESVAIILAAFAVLVPINLWTGARNKTTTYSLTLIVGLLLEVMGYVGRLLLRSNLASKSNFVLFLLGTTTGPTFITAAVYMIFPHILALYGSDLSIVPDPIWLRHFFLGWGIFTLALQAIGSAFAAEGTSKTEIQEGVNVLVAGLGLQVISILGFFGLYYRFMFRVNRNREFLDPRFSAVYHSTRFEMALLGIQVALVLILTRTAARMAQLLSGLDSTFSQSQVYLVVLDGILVLLAAIILTIFTPGTAFGRAWGMTSPAKKRARRHLSVLHPAQRSPGSPLHNVRPSPTGSPYGYLQGYHYATVNGKEPRSPPPSHTTETSSPLQVGMRRYMHKRQPPAQVAHTSRPPPYERPLINIARVPYIPPRAMSLSERYGQGTIVESQVVAPGSEIARPGGTGSSGGFGGSGGRTRTRSSPRVYEEDMVQGDALW
ncbi:Sphingoid long-chain base transporter RSB1 [Cytospora mali]|uniref:Sphingoid long-chain base transporter RSB1 n=1 Tax=Cytospora mali TaxID=578113 RepID=A0A194W873_CYTMA|nr:Sphingoid long-chain base transporter RSB1 [Valsa mali]